MVANALFRKFIKTTFDAEGDEIESETIFGGDVPKPVKTILMNEPFPEGIEIHYSGGISVEWRMLPRDA